MSTLVSSIPRPSRTMKSIASSTREYNRGKSIPSMPSLTLAPWGKDKSTINRHFPGRPLLGMTPKWLVCSGVAKGEEVKGPATLPSETSRARNCSTTSRFRRADFMFVDVAWRPGTQEGWKPSVKPCLKQVKR